jgi:hypothetical protein
MRTTSVLEIFIDSTCPNCAIAFNLADWVRKSFPSISIRVIDLSNSDREIPEAVFAVPTYLLNGKLIFLENPGAQELHMVIEAERSYLS